MTAVSWNVFSITIDTSKVEKPNKTFQSYCLIFSFHNPSLAESPFDCGLTIPAEDNEKATKGLTKKHLDSHDRKKRIKWSLEKWEAKLSIFMFLTSVTLFLLLIEEQKWISYSSKLINIFAQASIIVKSWLHQQNHSHRLFHNIRLLFIYLCLCI